MNSSLVRHTALVGLYLTGVCCHVDYTSCTSEAVVECRDRICRIAWSLGVACLKPCTWTASTAFCSAEHYAVINC